MKTRKDFKSEQQYRDYLVAYYSIRFASSFLQTPEFGNEDYYIAKSVKLSELLADEVIKNIEE